MKRFSIFSEIAVPGKATKTSLSQRKDLPFKLHIFNDEVVRRVKFDTDQGMVYFTTGDSIEKTEWTCLVKGWSMDVPKGLDEVLYVFVRASYADCPLYLYENHEAFRAIINSVLGVEFDPNSLGQ